MSRSCLNRKRRFIDLGGWPCVAYEMTTSVEECEATVASCSDYEEDCEKVDDVRSATAGDYSPTHPWDAPGMSIQDFI